MQDPDARITATLTNFMTLYIINSLALLRAASKLSMKKSSGKVAEVPQTVEVRIANTFMLLSPVDSSN